MKYLKIILVIVIAFMTTTLFSCQKNETARDKKKTGAGQSAEPDYDWIFQSSDQPGDIAFQMAVDWANDIYDASGGRIRITFKGAGAIVESNQTLDAMKNNILQGFTGDPSYFAGKDAAFSLYGNLIGAWRSPWDLIRFMYFGGGFDFANELLRSYGGELLGASTPGTEAFVSKVPIRTIADIQGVKLRAPEGMVQGLFKALGAAPVNLPGSEVYTSLEKGVIDAADYSIFARNQEQGMNDIAPYPIYPGWHSTPVYQMVLNKNIYDDLPADLQALLKLSGKAFSESFLMAHEDIDNAAVKTARDAGAEIVSWSAADIAKVRELAAELWVDASSKSPMAKKFYDIATRYLKNQGML